MSPHIVEAQLFLIERTGHHERGSSVARVYCPFIQGTQSASPEGERFALSEGSLLIDRFCFEIRHVAFRHGKPQDDLPADFDLGAC